MERKVSAINQTSEQKPPYAEFVLLVLAATLGGLTQNITNTALPALMADLQISITLGQLLTTVFPLCLGIVIPLVAYFSRRFAVRPLLLTSMSLFLIGTLIICFSSSFLPMLFGRILQGTSSAVATTMVQVVVMSRFPRERWGTLMGIVGIAMSFAPNIGPTIAGVFTSSFGWHSCFYFLAAFCGLILVSMAVGLRDDTLVTSTAKAPDFISVVTSSLGFGGLLVSFSEAANQGFLALSCIGPFIVGVVALILFFKRQTRLEKPLLNVRIFRNRTFTVGTILGCLLFGAFTGVTLIIPMHLQTVLSYSALESGLVLLPGAIAGGILTPITGIILDKVGARPVILTASCLLILGTVMLMDLGNMTSLEQIAFWQTVRAAGICSLVMPQNVWALSRLESETIADGTSLTNALRQVAASLGTAICVLLMANGVAGGSPTAAGVNTAMIFSLCITVAMFVLSLIYVKAGPLVRAK